MHQAHLYILRFQVIWTVLKEPTMMSAKLLDQFTYLEEKSGKRLVYTARDVQPFEQGVREVNSERQTDV